MKRILFFLMALPIICLCAACSGDDDSPNSPSLKGPDGGDEPKEVTVKASITENGVFDGILYYKITSNSPKKVIVCGATSDAVNIEIPNIVIINDSGYRCTSIAEEAFSYHENLKKMTVSNSVTSIGKYTFYGCSGLTSVSIPNSVTSIGEYTFYGCSSLTSVSIPNSVIFIGEYAFYGCSGLSSVIIPNSVTSIGEYTFYNCSGLTSVSIPSSVTFIGEYAFSYCSGLTEVISQNPTPPTIDSNNYFAFHWATKQNATLYVPIGSKTAYQQAAGWNEFRTIHEGIPSNPASTPSTVRSMQ